MAMLADRRKRVKWSLNPNGNSWSKDKNKFGQKMLEKMGWQEGCGLGAQLQGPKQHVKVTSKNDKKGLGFEGDDAIWLKMQEEYEKTLAGLRAVNGEAIDRSASHERKSLEEISKSSRARIHYAKFVRGKDLSRCSEKDLACIFGRPVRNVNQNDVLSSSKVQGHEVSQSLISSDVESTNCDLKETVSADIRVSDNVHDGKVVAEERKTVRYSKKKQKKRRHLEDQVNYEINREPVDSSDSLFHRPEKSGHKRTSNMENVCEKGTRSRLEEKIVDMEEGNLGNVRRNKVKLGDIFCSKTESVSNKDVGITNVVIKNKQKRASGNGVENYVSGKHSYDSGNIGFTKMKKKKNKKAQDSEYQAMSIESCNASQRIVCENQTKNVLELNTELTHNGSGLIPSMEKKLKKKKGRDTDDGDRRMVSFKTSDISASDKKMNNSYVQETKLTDTVGYIDHKKGKKKKKVTQDETEGNLVCGNVNSPTSQKKIENVQHETDSSRKRHCIRCNRTEKLEEIHGQSNQETDYMIRTAVGQKHPITAKENSMVCQTGQSFREKFPRKYRDKCNNPQGRYPKLTMADVDFSLFKGSNIMSIKGYGYGYERITPLRVRPG